MRWRLETAYGDPEAVPPTDDLIRFLLWSRDMRRRMGGNRDRSRARVAFKVAAVFALAAFAVWVNLRASEIDAAREMAASAGYPGLLAVSVISGFNLIAPIPVAVFYPFLMESGFDPIPTLITIALGMTGGDFLGYLIGDSSRELVGDHRLAKFRTRVEALRDRHPFCPLGFCSCTLPWSPSPTKSSSSPWPSCGTRCWGS